MKKISIVISFILYLLNNSFCTNKTKIVYLIPGQGSDGRLFKNLNLKNHQIKILDFVSAEKGDDMPAYAKRMAKQIDTSKPFSLIGVSIGGMIAIEINKVHKAEEVIIIASAKHREEIPKLYRTFNKFPVHKALGGNFLKFWVRLLQPIFEPMPKDCQTLWRDMLKQKDPLFMKCALACIITWEQDKLNSEDNITHIHGTKDNTLPYKNIEDAILIEEGTHVMTLTRADELSEIINEVLK